GEALDGAISVGISSYAAVALLGLAASADAGTSATLLGAGYALLASSGTLSDPNDLETWEQIESAARGQLTVAEFESAYLAGHVLSLDDAVILARSVVAKHGGAEPSILRANVTVAQSELVEQLTARERETLRLLASGLTNKEIAAAMVVSVRTVENHVANLYGKIGARGRADATAFALSHGLMTSPA
ncbi:MAG: LuxR C-terminal-related transcriptional regulator, partial [Tepidiformaceae bacterium]